MKKTFYEENDTALILKTKKTETYFDNDFRIETKNFILPLIQSRLEKKKRNVLMNMENVELINSHGITALLQIYDCLEKNEGTLAFCCIHSLIVKNALRKSGLEVFCEKHIYDTENAALTDLT